VLEYRKAVLTFSLKLVQIIALALDLPEGHFDSMMRFPAGGLRPLHYPSQEFDTDIGLGAHADYSWFTLVNQLSTTSALEVLNHNGAWIPAPPIANTLVVNVGDFLERATNDVFVSTVHRVVNKTGRERYSLPFFLSPNQDAIVKVLPSCVTEDRPARYESIRCGDWLDERLLRARRNHPLSIAAREQGEI
jgi:isopenicillin N synthase-like dioxygenase